MPDQYGLYGDAVVRVNCWSNFVPFEPFTLSVRWGAQRIGMVFGYVIVTVRMTPFADIPKALLAGESIPRPPSAFIVHVWPMLNGNQLEPEPTQALKANVNEMIERPRATSFTDRL